MIRLAHLTGLAHLIQTGLAHLIQTGLSFLVIKRKGRKIDKPFT